jgi:PhnB protein
LLKTILLRQSNYKEKAMQVQPYLFFHGRCEEAVEFYRGALGAEVGQLMRFSENPDCKQLGPAVSPDKVMHVSFRVGDTEILASDGMGDVKQLQGFSLALTAPTGAEAERLFNALSSEGKVEMPLGKTFFTTHFGVVTDRFGVSWMVTVP